MKKFIVEYDMQYSGGNYDDVGEFVVVEAQKESDVKREFRKQMRIDPVHIVSFKELDEDEGS
jgi:hypothetical protein